MSAQAPWDSEPHNWQNEKRAKADRASHLAYYGCCGAFCKEACTNPPCPCNQDYWSEHERRQLRLKGSM